MAIDANGKEKSIDWVVQSAEEDKQIIQNEPMCIKSVVATKKKIVNFKALFEKKLKSIRQSNSLEKTQIEKKVPGGTLLMQGNQVISFIGGAELGLKHTKLVFNDKNQLHGQCVIDGKKYDFENNKRK